MKTITRTIRAMMPALATCIASFAGMASARTITVTENKTGDVTTSFDLTFSPRSADTTNSLWMVYGMADGGTGSFADWTNAKYLGSVPGDVMSMSGVSVPDGWGTTSCRLRFILASDNGIPNAGMLEYIKANGAHVTTSFVPTEKAAVEIDFNLNTVAQNQCLFCSRSGSDLSNKSFTLFWLSSYWRWDYDKNGPHVEVSPEKARHTLRADSSGLTIDTKLLKDSVSSSALATFTAGGAMTILTSYSSSGVNSGHYCKLNLYSFKAWTNGTDETSLALDLVPCVKADGTVCLYNRVDGEFLSKQGSGTFTSGGVSSTVMPESASDLVTVDMPGWVTTKGAYYPYVYPVYVVDVASSSSIADANFKKVDADGSSVTTDVSYAEFVGADRTGTIIKRGGGTLAFDRALVRFTGPVHIEDGVGIGSCSNCFGYTVNANAGANQRTYVHSGATLVMDAADIRSRNPEANAVYYEGDGYAGMGGAYVMQLGSVYTDYTRWPMGSGSQAAGPARLFVDIPSGKELLLTAGNSTIPPSNFSVGGQELLIYGRTVGSVFGPNATSIKDIGNLVVSNLTLALEGVGGAMLPTNGNDSTIHFTGGSRWYWNTQESGAAQSGEIATVYIDDMEYAKFFHGNSNSGYGVDPWNNASNTRNWYRGPMVLNDDFRIYNTRSPHNGYTGNDANYWGCTFSAKVSGQKGFRPWFNMSRNKACGDYMRLNLLYPTNTFEGGIVIDGGSLGVWAERAVPSQEGAGLVSVTNGYVYFGRKGPYPSTMKWPVFEMPVTEFVGFGAVTNGTGTWQGLVKKGTGTLDYNSQLGGTYLDLQNGKVKFNTQYRGAYTGENATYAPDGYAAALPVFTTLKGRDGTLDLEGVGGGTYTVANVEGTPSVTNGNLTVTGAWTVDAATLSTHAANIFGTLAFGEGATITVTGDLGTVSRPQGGFVIAKAENITGSPRLYCKGRSLLVSNGQLRLVKGFMIDFR